MASLIALANKPHILRSFVKEGCSAIVDEVAQLLPLARECPERPAQVCRTSVLRVAAREHRAARVAVAERPLLSGEMGPVVEGAF
jgi:hypothetical protein